MKLLGDIGEPQARSANRELLEVAAPSRVILWSRPLRLDLAARFPFNPDIDPSPAVVDDFRARVLAADGLIFARQSTPSGLPGSLKNLLDWLVGTGRALTGNGSYPRGAAPKRRARGSCAAGRTWNARFARGAPKWPKSRRSRVPTTRGGHDRVHDADISPRSPVAEPSSRVSADPLSDIVKLKVGRWSLVSNSMRMWGRGVGLVGAREGLRRRRWSRSRTCSRFRPRPLTHLRDL